MHRSCLFRLFYIITIISNQYPGSTGQVPVSYLNYYWLFTAIEVIAMVRNGIDYEKEKICDLFFNQIMNLTKKTAKNKKR